MKKKTKLLILLSMIAMATQAQENVFVSDDRNTEVQTASAALNMTDQSIEISEDVIARSNDQRNFPEIEIETIQKKEDLNFSLTASAISEEESVLLSIDEFDGLKYTLLDLDGRILDAKQIVSFETSVEFVYLIPSDYFLEVSSEEEMLKRFKVVKK